MTIDDGLRAVAGFFIILSVLLAVFHTPYWLYFTGFVGVNLLQSAFSKSCPMMLVLEKLGLPQCREN